MSNDRLVDFIQELDTNPDLLKKYQENPKETAEKYGLEPSDVKVVVENNQTEINKRFEEKRLSPQRTTGSPS